jgi:ssDNA-binding Zn-finger/Zn-ribbon topoisomerase 1
MCRVATWDEPVDRACPRCGKAIMLRKVGKSGTVLYCRDEKCGSKEQVKDGEKNETRT